MAKQISSGWTQDHKAEAILNDLGIEFKIVPVPIKSIDWKLAAKNPARSDRAIDEELLEDYVTSMKAGDEFPSPIMIQKKGKFYPPAGMHRTTAAQKAGRKEIISYVPTHALTSYQERMIAIMSNRKEGKRVAKSEAYVYGSSLVLDEGLIEREVAKNLGVNEKTLSKYVRSEKLRRTAMTAGFSGNLAQTTWESLNKLGNNETVLVAAAAACNGLNMPIKEVNSFIKDIKKGKNEKDTLNRISKYMQENKAIIQTQKGRNTRAKLNAPLRDGFFRRLRDLRLAVEGKTLKSIQMAKGSPEHKKAKKEAKETFNLVTKILR